MKKPSPSIPQLRAWRADEVTDWVMKQLNHRYPDYHAELPIKTPDQALSINTKVGNRQILEAIEKLVEHGEC